MRELACDVAVIGAGTAGIAARRAADKAGARAVLIERGPGGTTCARVGCMPSKLLIAAGAAAHSARNTDLFGIRVSGVSVDGPAVLARLRAERDRFVGGVFEGLDDLPAETRIAGAARFVDRDTLVVGEHTRIRFRAAVIATGSSPTVPGPLRGLGAGLLTTDTVFETADLPESLAVLGAGAVGIEIAQAMARLGVAVTVIDAGDTIAGLSEPDLADQAAAIFGVELALHRNATLEAAELEDGGVRLDWTDRQGRAQVTRAARVLAAAGRAPNLDALNLAAAGLHLGEDGVPDFDRRSLVCAGAPILIAGDADAWRPVLHEASRQGEIAGTNAAALAAGRAVAAVEPWTSLAMVFTHPQAAAIGAPYTADRADRLVGAMDFSDQGRARVDGHNRGGLRIWADREGRLLGGEMLGPAVEHLAHLLTYAVADGLTAQEAIDRPIYHPTVEEALKTALRGMIQQKDKC
ncbi:dihydrolipoamide dehydrogenase [Methylobacterium phyllostachyos]|uniref:Dihydrolipoamide dehydrogenase n=1 Tax=Methylobacterium phyllostachyos TaxID=582672 RepID=A0A1H0EXY0_9HYPH|nr:dihydrolipoyl dehydrogenase [Methylobacterium phyllostachyos]SDN87211.1 dihydrolipoamide dehydrogenase [Methylobacterium phyllostachyos]